MLKAYSIEEEEFSEIVFAATRGKAIYQSETYHGCLEFTAVKATRATQFDQYAELGRVPDKAMIEAGWWLECQGCYRHLTAEMEDDDGNPVEVYYAPDGTAYCSEGCWGS